MPDPDYDSAFDVGDAVAVYASGSGEWLYETEIEGVDIDSDGIPRYEVRDPHGNRESVPETDVDDPWNRGEYDEEDPDG